ncbi:MAG: UDP-N-acetylglucosamine 2-epimerase (non-hydrolyzing) [Gemmatimonadetes bacterium]|nr:UDP-N-acetylglucosamine 2-epimerase (non-hydrolyzing) [Gemmatimonadota bacterium]
MPRRLLYVVGARPNFMKAAPLLAASTCAETLLVHTGQHYGDAMSRTFFRELEMREPDVNLGVGSGSHARQTAAVLVAFEPVVLDWRPDAVVVVGDVNSTLACALTAAKLGVPVAHVEAGLRSFDRAMPEEINRVLVDQLAELLLTPDRGADANLLREGIAPERIHRVGNVMIDSLVRHLPRARTHPVTRELERGRYVVATLHRPSNVDDAEQLAEIFGALAALAERTPVIFSMHPRTRGNAERFGLMAALGGVRVLEPQGYLAMLALQAGAALVITDSGGVQEETTALGIPCVTLRTTTERPITVTEGTNALVPVRTREHILRAAADAPGRRGRVPELWDGHAAERAVRILCGCG